MRSATLSVWIGLAAWLQAAPPAPAGEPTIVVRAGGTAGPVSRYLTGVCIEDVNHEIYGGLYSQMVFGESFQEPPPSPTVRGFKAYGGTWVVDPAEGSVSVRGADGPKLVSDLAPFRSGALGVEIFFPGREGQSAGLIARLSRPGVGADAFTGYEIAVDPDTQVLHVARHRQNYEPIATVPCAVPVGRWFRLHVLLIGSQMTVRVDGKDVFHHDDRNLALVEGTVALRAWHREVRFRDLWVEPAGKTLRLPFEPGETSAEVSGMWRPVVRGKGTARFSLVTDRPFVGTQSQRVELLTQDDRGAAGVENQGLNRWGLSFEAGKPYEGYVWARAERPVTLHAALESRDGSKTYAGQALGVPAGDWTRLDLALTPSATDRAGRFTLTLEEPGAVTLGHAFLQPGAWGRFKGLPVRKDVADAMVDQGLTVLRYGGSLVNNPAYRWKTMIGPRDRRPPYKGTWYPYTSNGWGVVDFLDFCEAAGFEGIPTFFLGETPQDMADFVEYARGPVDGEWGRRRAADGHPAPYPLKAIELGNEERVDDAYAAKFEALAEAIWARAPGLILVVGDFAYDRPITDPFHFTGSPSGITTLAAHKRILEFARKHNGEVWFDVHVGTEAPRPVNPSLQGMFTFTDAIDRFAEGARHKVVVFEFNAGNHAMRRALANALAIQAVERDGRLPVATSANGLQPDGQNDNGWDQGLLFLNPAQVWLQPPGHVTRMIAQNYLPRRVECRVEGDAGGLDVLARRSDDGKTVVVQVVNPGDSPRPARLALDGFTPAKPEANVTELAAPPDAVNTAENPDRVAPRSRAWAHALGNGPARYTFPPHSFTVLRFE